MKPPLARLSGEGRRLVLGGWSGVDAIVEVGPVLARAAVRQVILCGGGGTRLWPSSRLTRPKQLLPFAANQTMLQVTFERARALCDEVPMIVTGSSYAAAVEDQLGGHFGTRIELLIEPFPRGTAAAVALAAYAVADDELLLVMPSDHVIDDAGAFTAAVATARAAAADGWLVTFGTRAVRAETGYGYIHGGEELSTGVRRVLNFIEKPDRATAERFVASGEYSWNSGIYLFSAGALRAELRTHAPDIASAAEKAIAGAAREGERLLPDVDPLITCPSTSIDYAVLENTDRAVVLPVEMGWSDVGSWDALHTLRDADENGTVVEGEVIALDTRNCLIRSEGPLIATVGVENLIVVATEDAVLILPKGRSQDVKRIVEELKARRHPTLER